MFATTAGLVASFPAAWVTKHKGRKVSMILSGAMYMVGEFPEPRLQFDLLSLTPEEATQGCCTSSWNNFQLPCCRCFQAPSF
jgi:hypothetical protein